MATIEQGIGPRAPLRPAVPAHGGVGSIAGVLPDGFIPAAGADGATRLSQAPLMRMDQLADTLLDARAMLGSSYLHLAKTIDHPQERTSALSALNRALRDEVADASLLKARSPLHVDAFKRAYTDFHTAVHLLDVDLATRVPTNGSTELVSARASLAEVYDWVLGTEQAFKAQAELWGRATGRPASDFLTYAMPTIRYQTGAADGVNQLLINGKPLDEAGGILRGFLAGLRRNVGAAQGAQSIFTSPGKTVFDIGLRNQMMNSLNVSVDLIGNVLHGQRALRLARAVL